MCSKRGTILVDQSSTLTERILAESRSNRVEVFDKLDKRVAREQSYLIMSTLIKRAQKLLGITSAPNMLDVGCGDGMARETLVRTFGRNYIGIDASDEWIDQQRGIRCVALEDCPTEWIGRVDILFCSRVLEESDNLNIALAKMKRLLSPKGIIAHISDYERGRSDKYPYSLDPSDWIGMYERFNFTPLTVECVRLTSVELHMILCRAEAFPYE